MKDVNIRHGVPLIYGQDYNTSRPLATVVLIVWQDKRKIAPLVEKKVIPPGIISKPVRKKHFLLLSLPTLPIIRKQALLLYQ